MEGIKKAPKTKAPDIALFSFIFFFQCCKNAGKTGFCHPMHSKAGWYVFWVWTSLILFGIPLLVLFGSWQGICETNAPGGDPAVMSTLTFQPGMRVVVNPGRDYNELGFQRDNEKNSS